MYGIPPLLIDTAIALIIGYAVVTGIALATRPSGKRMSFIQNNGLDFAAGTLGAIFGSAFVSIFVWGIVFFVIHNAFGFPNDEQHRLYLFAVVYIAVFISGITYCAFRLAKESR